MKIWRTKLREVKDRREIAQYSVTKKTTKDLAEKTKLDARAFVDRVEEIKNPTTASGGV